MQLVDLLGGECQFGDDVGIGGVAVEGIRFGGNIEAVFLAEPVEIVFHMEAVHTLGRTVDVVILTTVVTVNGEAVFKIVADHCLAQRDETIAAREGIDIHFILVAVSAVQDLLANLLLFPFEPIGNMGELGFALGGLQLAVFLEEPALAAMVAENLRALGSHLEFGVAVGALVENFLKTFRTIGLSDQNVVFQLIAVFVVLHSLVDDRIDLIGGHFCHLLGGEYLAKGGMQGDVPLVGVSPEGRVQMVAMMGHHHQGNFVHLHQTTQGIGQVRGSTDGSVSRFGVHTQNITVLENSADGFDQVDVVGEFSCADGTDPGQQPGHHVVAVDVDHIVDLVGMGDHVRQLEIDEGLMVTEDDVRRLQTLHINSLQGVFFADQADFG